MFETLQVKKDMQKRINQKYAEIILLAGKNVRISHKS